MPPESPSATILVIDDDSGSRTVLKLLLERQGFRTLTASNGADGLLLAKTARPQVILLDVIMPKLDGYHVLHRLKNDPDTQRIPVIMLTARGADKDVQRSFQLGAVFHVEKPFETADLLQKIQIALVEGSSS